MTHGFDTAPPAGQRPSSSSSRFDPSESDGPVVPPLSAATPPHNPTTARHSEVVPDDSTTTMLDDAPTTDLRSKADLSDSRLRRGDDRSSIAAVRVEQREVHAAPGVATVVKNDDSPEGNAGKTGLPNGYLGQPDDVDALFTHAVELHRRGQIDGARSVLAQLASVYQIRGQQAQAHRILQMLRINSPGAQPSEPATRSTATRTENPATTKPIQSVTARLRQTGRLANSQTVPLRQTGQLTGSLDDPTAPAMEAPFAPETLEFTIPLPGEAALEIGMRQIIEESATNLSAGHYDAAMDACLQVLAIDDTYLPISVRIAEIYTAQRQLRRARIQAETLLRLMAITKADDLLWMGYRILLHTSERNLGNLRSLVERLIDAGQTDLASFYASRLIQMLDGEGLAEEALGYSVRLCGLVPGDTRAALENAILRLKSNDPEGAVERWELAVAAGADSVSARASIAAIMVVLQPDDHWNLLGELLPVVRAGGDPAIVEAYTRTAAVMDRSPVLDAGAGVLLAAIDDSTAGSTLAHVAGDRAAPPMARAISALILARLSEHAGKANEHVAALRTALQLLDHPTVSQFDGWTGLLGGEPQFDQLSLLLAQTLMESHDIAGAVDVLKLAHQRTPYNEAICELLADAYFQFGQLGNALTVLDGLAAHYREQARLEPMATVLRRMSRLAPNNIKVKSRLIDTFLQRGFVTEAREELIQRAELEERSGLIHNAVVSLRRAADLAWAVNKPDETFEVYHRIIELAPEVVDHRHGVVALYLQVGRLAEAAEHQRAIVDISMRADRKHEAVAALHQVIGLTPDDTSAYYQLGELLGSAGEYRQAERVFRRILTITPDDDVAVAKANSMAALAEQQTG